MARYIDTDYLDELITQLNNEGRGITRNEYKMIDSILFEFPTADVVERKKGKWIRRSDIPNAYTCSNCYQVIYAKNRKYLAEYHAFCGKCGLDMREETEDEEK